MNNRFFVVPLTLLINVFFINAQLCKAPQALIVDSLTQTSARVSWSLSEGDDIPSKYAITLKQGNIVIYYDTSAFDTLSFHCFTGLNTNTSYTFIIQGDCSATYSGYSDEDSITFTTLCYSQNGPYNQNFDSSNSLSEECVVFNNASLSSTFSQSGSKSVELSTTTADNAYVIFPEMNYNSDDVEMTLWVNASDVSKGAIPITAGIIHDMSDILGSFEPLLVDSLTTTNWTEFRINTSSTAMAVTNTTRMAVFILSGYNCSTFIDDVLIHNVLSCTRPEGLSVSNVTHNSVDLSWNTTNADTVRVYVISANDTTFTTLASNPGTVANLNSNSDYSFSMRGICNSGNDSSDITPVVSAHTSCAPGVIPVFYEGFENSATPDCWMMGWLNKTANNNETVPFTLATDYMHNGTHSFKLVNQSLGNRSWLSTIPLPIDSVGKYTLSVWVKRDNAPGYPDEALKFWAAPSLGSIAGATLLGEVHRHYGAPPVEAVQGWYQYQFPINAVGTLYILIEGISENGNAIYFDDMEVSLTPSCLKVYDIDIDDNNITTTDAQLIWRANGSEQSWEVGYVVSHNGSALINDTVVTSNPTLTINNLSPAQTYTIYGYVKALCTDSDSNLEGKEFYLTFSTACMPTTSFPYTEGFEGNLFPPLCWSNIALEGSMLWSRNVTSAYVHSGSVSARLLPANNHTEILSTGQFLLDSARNYMTSLWVYRHNQSHSDNDLLHIYISPSCSDTAGAYELGEINAFYALYPTENNDGYHKYEYLIPDTISGLRYILCLFENNNGNGIYIDDIEIAEQPDCLPVSGGCLLSYDTPNSIRVQISDTTVGSWDVAYGLNGCQMSQLTTITGIIAADTIVANLTPNNQYDFYVRRNCGTGYSEWSTVTTINSSCSAEDIPFFDDFEDYPTTAPLAGCYNTRNQGTSMFENCYLNVVSNSTYNHTSGGTNGLTVGYANGPCSSCSGSFDFYRTFNLETGKNYKVTIFAKTRQLSSVAQPFSYNIDFMVGLSKALATPISTVSVANTEDFEQYCAYFTSVQNGEYWIGFNITPVNSLLNMNLDDWSIEEITCAPPVSATDVSTTTTTALISVSSAASQWEIAVSSSPIDIKRPVFGDIYQADTITSSLIPVSGLTQNTEYYYTLRSICNSNDTSDWMEPLSFRTRCAAVDVPYYEGFENQLSDFCWKSIGNVGTVMPSLSTKHGGRLSLNINAATALSPELNVVTLSSYMLNGWISADSDSAEVLIGIINDPNDPASLEILNGVSVIVPKANKWTEFMTTFDILNDSSYSDFYNARYIVLVSSDNVYIDDIDIYATPTCQKPSAGIIRNVSSHSLDMDWSDNNLSSVGWIVKAAPVSGGTTVFDTVVSHPSTLNGLDAATTYLLYVSALCQSGGQSYFSYVGDATTDCDFVKAPWNETFEFMTSNEPPLCWTTSPTFAGPTQVYYLWGVYEYEGRKQLRLCNNLMQAGEALLETPQIILDSTKGYEFEFKLSHRSNSGAVNVEVKNGNGSYVLLDAITIGAQTLHSADPGVFTRYSYDVSSYAGDTVQFKFSNTANSGQGAIYLDDISVKELSDCRKVKDVTIASLRNDSAVVVFNDTVPTHTQWQYAVGLSGFDVDTAQYVSITSDTIVLAHLADAAFYDIYIRAKCSETDLSDWNILTFRSSASPAELPFVCDFSNQTANNAWDFGGTGNQFAIGNDVDAVKTAEKALYVTDGNDFGYNCMRSTGCYAARLFNLESSTYSFNIDWQCIGGQIGFDGARFYLAPASGNIIPTGTGNSFSDIMLPAGSVSLDDEIRGTSLGIWLKSGWQHLCKTIDMSGRAGQYFLVFFWNNNGHTSSDSNHSLSIDRVEVKELSCKMITNISVAETTQNTITAIIDNPNDNAITEWAISSVNDVTSAVQTGTANNDTIQIQNLSASTTYYIFVRSVCLQNDTSPWISTTASTDCGVITQYPYTEDFENSFPKPCWNITTLSSGSNNNNVQDPTWEKFVSNGLPYCHSGSHSAHLNAGKDGSVLLSLPQMHFDSSLEYHISFWFYEGYGSAIADELHICLGTSNITTFASDDYMTLIPYNESYVSSFTLKMRQVNVDIPVGTDGDYYVLFKGDQYGYTSFIYIDDVVVDIYPKCHDLSGTPDVELTTATTANVEIGIGHRDEVEFAYAIDTTGVTPADAIASVTSTIGMATLTGLTPNVQYALFARGICQEGDTTAWTSSATFTTKTCDCFAPDNLRLATGSAAPDYADVIWNAAPDAVQYEFELRSGSSVVRTGYTQTTTLHLDSLNINTNYVLSVRTVCATDTTIWSQLSFRTLADAATVPYICGFENPVDNATWYYVTSYYDNNFFIGNDTNAVNSGSRSLYVSDNYSTYRQSVPTDGGGTWNNVYGVSFARRTVYFSEAGKYEVSYNWKNPMKKKQYGYYNAYGRSFIAPSNATFVADVPTYATGLPTQDAVMINPLMQCQDNWTQDMSIVSINEPCYRDIVFVWYSVNEIDDAAESEANADPLAIDNLSVTKVECMPVTSMTADFIGEDSLSVIVFKNEPVDIGYGYSTVNDVDSIVWINHPSTSYTDTLNISGLASRTAYYVFVRQICSDSASSKPRYLSVSTMDIAAPLPFICGFETTDDTSGWRYIQDDQTNYFIIGTATSSSGNKSLYITNDSLSNAYTSSVPSYAFVYRSLRLSPGQYEYSYDWNAIGDPSYDFGRAALVPATKVLIKESNNGFTASSLPVDAIPLDDGKLNLSQNWNTESGYITILDDAYYSLVFFWQNNNLSGDNPPLAIDNVSFKALTCMAPAVTVVDNSVRTNSVSVAIDNPNEGSSVVVCATTTGFVADADFIDTIPYSAVSSVDIIGLSSASSYHIMAKAICGENDESIWAKADVRTLCSVVSSFPYVESFESLPESYSNGIINSLCWNAVNDNSSYPNYKGSSDYASDGTKSLSFVSTVSTPLFMILPEMDSISDLSVSFDYIAANDSAICIGYLADPTNVSTFTIVESMQASASTIFFANAQVNFGVCPAGARIAFRYTRLANSSSYDAFIDNIRVSRLVDGGTFYDTLCYNNSYFEHGFSVHYSKLKTGSNTLVMAKIGINPGEADTIFHAIVEVLPKIETTIYDTICSGMAYTKGMWNITRPISRRYLKVFSGSSVNGCDSTVVLMLTVIPNTTVLRDTICANDTYIFGDSIITKAGAYARRYLSPYGCTMTDSLYLFSYPDTVYYHNTVCASETPYIWNGQSYSASGIYTQQILGSGGCSQIAVLSLTVIPSDTICNVSFCKGGCIQVSDTVICTQGHFSINRFDGISGCRKTYQVTAVEQPVITETNSDFVCEGKPYYGYGISDLIITSDTVITLNITTIDGKCDSISIVDLTYLPTVYADTEYVSVTEGGFYEWQGNTYTQPGTYTETLQSDMGCDSIVTLVLSFKGVGIDDVFIDENEIVDIYDAKGSLIGHGTLGSIYVHGIYFVRRKDGSTVKVVK